MRVSIEIIKANHREIRQARDAYVTLQIEHDRCLREEARNMVRLNALAKRREFAFKRFIAAVDKQIQLVKNHERD